MKLTTTLLLIIFSIQISAQDSLIFLRIDFTFEIEPLILYDSFLEKNNNSTHRYQLKEIKPTALLTKEVVSIRDIYKMYLGFEKPLDSRFFFKTDGYTFWTKPKYFDSMKWDHFTNVLGYRKSQNLFFYGNENGVAVGHIFPRENYLRSSFETHFPQSDLKMYFNFIYSNEIYYREFEHPASVSNRFKLHFPKSFAEQRFIKWIPIRFPLYINPFQNIAQMSLNFVFNPAQKLLIKTDVESNFIFSKNNREHVQTFTIGFGVQITDETLVFINRSKPTKYSSILRNDELMMTLNIRQRLVGRNFPKEAVNFNLVKH